MSSLETSAGPPAQNTDPVPAPRILLVEDSPADVALVRTTLTEAWNGRLDVPHVGTIAAARAELHDRRVTCVLLDLGHPDSTGIEAVIQIVAAAPEVPLVVLSANPDEELAMRAVQEGAQDYIVKGRTDGPGLERAIRYAVERKRAERELAHRALRDPLTGLPNRILFLERLSLALARAKRQPGSTAVLFVDLDRFKEINDTFGHEAGDRVLIDVTARLRGVTRPTDTVARFGGDEFTVLCESLASEHQARVIAQRIAAAVAQPLEAGGQEVEITASIGIALSRDADAVPQALLRDADAAMYRAKEKGRSRYELFDEVMRARAAERLDTEAALQRALERAELRVFYLRQVALSDERTTAVEALVRWEKPRQGLVLPAGFVSLAEETGLIVPIGLWVLRRACQELDALGTDLALTINLSARQLADPLLADNVAAALADTGLAPERLWVDIGEAAAMADPEDTPARLESLAGLGVRIALDDVGTGTLSLPHLRNLPLDALKLDRSLVSPLGRVASAAPLAGALIALAHALDLDAVAEGVETEAQARLLRELGCDSAQGHYFGPPQPLSPDWTA